MLETLFKSSTQRVLSKYNSQIQQINSHGKIYKSFTDVELRDQTQKLKQRLDKGASQISLLPEAFALVREASDRVLGLRHFDVQLIGGMILNEGKIAEMKTGEGKTIVALLPTFLNALAGNGTQVITVNDYLARRDAEYVGQVHQFLGLSVGLIQENMSPLERKENYLCDVVYVTNNELGFDYLRDNMAYTKAGIVQRSFFYCVIDEVDSILIDEARTPLIISGLSDSPTDKYISTTALVKTLKRDIHYNIDEKAQRATLSSEGVSFCEQALNVADLYNLNEPWMGYILNSIKAKELYLKNKNYIINSEQEIVIVDEFTGRTMQGRRWSDGLHQSIEAKEGVPIQAESQTLASISYQNLFLLYPKLSGMTGTAKTEEGEFEKIYNLNVVQIPTNELIKRKDLSDLIFINQYIKWKSVAQECLDMHQVGRPVLIGTTTIKNSELLAALLTEYTIPYRLLNAKPENVESEADIIAQAGCRNAITIATNMAGRGTDILLGGNPTFLTKLTLQQFFLGLKQEQLPGRAKELLSTVNEKIKNELYARSSELLNCPIQELVNDENVITQFFVKFYNTILSDVEVSCRSEGEKIRSLGGLHVIGTERHESRRIDNQLRGRSGRQGDPGSSRFFLSLEDKLLRIFGGEQIITMMQNIGFQDSTPIQSSLLDKSLESAQKKVEAYYFDTRKQVFEYDEALNIQRNGIYLERRKILQRKNLKFLVLDYADRSLYDVFLSLKVTSDDISFQSLVRCVQNLMGVPFIFNPEQNENNLDQKFSFIRQQIQITYDLKELELESIQKGLIRELEQSFILQQIDYSWQEHLQKIAFLRESISWRAYGQKNPLTEYKKEAFSYFLMMIARIRHRVVYFVLRSKTIVS